MGLLRGPASARHRDRRAPRDGETLLTDGPFAEANEHIGGFTLIEAPGPRRRAAWAGRMARASTLPIEVRPVADHY